MRRTIAAKQKNAPGAAGDAMFGVGEEGGMGWSERFYKMARGCDMT
jgi:hypothetical protein